MATRPFTTPVGVDLRGLAAHWQIAGITVDNPSGSWLTIPNAGVIPPYVTGWAASFSPTILNVDVLFTDSPSGTPSQLVGNPITVTLSDVPVGTNPGVPSGAAEIQQPGQGAVTGLFSRFTLREAENLTALIIGGIPDHRIVPIRWLVQVAVIRVGGIPGTGIRTPVQIMLADANGLVLFPHAVISPENPSSGWLPASATLGNYSDPGANLNIGGVVMPGGGRVDIDSYLDFYTIRAN